MNYLKTTLVILGLIGIGFLGGFFTHRAITIDKINRVAKLRDKGGFAEHLINRLEPTTAQEEQLRPIIDKYAKAIASIHKDCKTQRVILLDSLSTKIRPILTEEQIQVFFAFSTRYRKSRKSKQEKLVKRK